MEGTLIKNLETADETFSLLSDCLDAFAEAWEDGAVPLISDFLPRDPSLRRACLLELIKADLEFRWLRLKRPKVVAEYLEDFPELAECGIPAELVLEELHIRKGASDAGIPPENLPELSPIATSLAKQVPLTSTSLFRRKRPDHIVEGDRIGDFELLSRLGQGCFANVFLARQISMGSRWVAVKVSAEVGEEADNLGQLKHDAIVTVHSVDRMPERRAMLLCMEFVPGGTLRDVVSTVREHPPKSRSGKLLLQCVDAALAARDLPVPNESFTRKILGASDWNSTVCWIGIHLVRGLEYAHGRPMLHRDIKPDNILLSETGKPKLADFNISFGANVASSTPDAYFGGSLRYMSPEQLDAFRSTDPSQAANVTSASDVYSLAVVLWELYSGNRPWNDESHEEDLYAVMLRRRREEFSELSNSVTWKDDADSEELRSILIRCLNPDPDQRPKAGLSLCRQLVLASNPTVHSALHPSDSLSRWASRYPKLAVTLCGVVPNVFMALCATGHNNVFISKKLPEHLAQRTWVIGGVIALTVFLLQRYSQPLIKALRNPRTPTDDPQRLIRISLNRNWVDWWGIVAAWCVSSFAFALISGREDIYIYIQYLSSQLGFGIVGASLAGLCIAALDARCVLPRFLKGEPAPRLKVDLHSFEWRANFYVLLVTLVVPVLVLRLLFLTPAAAEAADDYTNVVLAGICLIGIPLMLLANTIHLRIKNSVTTLRRLVTPTVELLESGQEVVE